MAESAIETLNMQQGGSRVRTDCIVLFLIHSKLHSAMSGVPPRPPPTPCNWQPCPPEMVFGSVHSEPRCRHRDGRIGGKKYFYRDICLVCSCKVLVGDPLVRFSVSKVRKN